MILRNKKTGETINLGCLNVSTGTSEKFEVKTYASLAELNEDWEDYEEPKEYWFIDSNGVVLCESDNGSKFDMGCKQIGNHFGTKEEAKKAVEKLKAWKRLKDVGFRFGGWETDSDGDLRSVLCNRKDRVQFNNDETLAMAKDLDLLFGGEE